MTRERLIAAAVVGGYAMLLLDIRFEHRNELEEALPWIPIIFSGLMLVVGSICVGLWNLTARRVLLGLFVCSLVVGVLGVWFHSHGNPIAGIGRVLSVWYQKPAGRGGPPVLAPLAFAGLGTIGLITAWGKGS